MPRVNINISDELKLYFEKMAMDTGASQSSLMAFALNEFVNQRKNYESVAELAAFMKENQKGIF